MEDDKYLKNYNLAFIKINNEDSQHWLSYDSIKPLFFFFKFLREVVWKNSKTKNGPRQVTSPILNFHGTFSRTKCPDKNYFLNYTLMFILVNIIKICNTDIEIDLTIIHLTIRLHKFLRVLLLSKLKKKTIFKYLKKNYFIYNYNFFIHC